MLRILRKIKRLLSFEGKILVTYAEKPGVFDIEKLSQFRDRTKIKKVILLYSTLESEAVRKAAHKLAVELVKCDERRKCIDKIVNKLKDMGEDVLFRRIEEIADRSLMRDVS